jgi:hypothetical protein
MDNLDIAFVVDTTGSMKDDINAVRDSLLDIIKQIIEKTSGLTIRFGLVSYRDHPPQDRTYVTKTLDLTQDIKQVHKEISRLKPSEGGDTPEAVADALHDARVKMSWGTDAYKVLLLVGDAPPHGKKYNRLEDDYFPDGCPKGLDPIQELEEIKKLFGSTLFVFVCGCNPLVEESFRVLAESVQDGRYYSLLEAKELPTAILEILEGVGELIALDRRVLQYYVANDGSFDIPEGADTLGISIREMKTSISRLIELERIPKWPRGRPLVESSTNIAVELGEIPDALIAGKAVNYRLIARNPGRISASIRVLVSMISSEGISEVLNELHELPSGSEQTINLRLVPMIYNPGRASIRIEVLYGSKTIESKIYETRIFSSI